MPITASEMLSVNGVGMRSWNALVNRLWRLSARMLTATRRVVSGIKKCQDEDSVNVSPRVKCMLMLFLTVAMVHIVAL